MTKRAIDESIITREIMPIDTEDIADRKRRWFVAGGGRGRWGYGGGYGGYGRYRGGYYGGRYYGKRAVDEPIVPFE